MVALDRFSGRKQPAPGLLALLPAMAMPFAPGTGNAGGALASAAAVEGAGDDWAACCEPCGNTLSRRKRTGHSAAEPLLRLAASRIACGMVGKLQQRCAASAPGSGRCREGAA